ncbi:MAG: sporulation protein YunB [Christensenellales bacterium]
MKLFLKKRSKTNCVCDKKKKRKRLAILILVVVCINVLIIFFGTNINNVVYSYSESKVRALSVKAVNNAVSELVTNKNIYDNLVNITTDNEGNIILIQANSIQINMLTKDLIKTSQIKLEKIGADGINIPIGTFSGITLLNGRGPAVNIKLIPVGDVSCNFQSEFLSAGINQTIHKLYVTVDTSVNIILPLKNNTVKTTTSILICESVIVGKIPQVYLNSNKLDNLLDLVP